MNYLLWDCLSLEQKKLILSIAPKGWKPPINKSDKTYEDLEEIKVIISEAPKNVKRNGRW